MKVHKKLDKVLLLLMLVLSIVSLIVVYSSSNAVAVLRMGLEGTHFFKRQLFFVAATWGMGFLIIRIPISFYKRFYKFFIWAIVLFLIYLVSYGTLTNNVKSWASVLGFTFQPSEFAKLFIILYLAFVFNKKQIEKNINLKNIILIMLAPALVVVFTLLQPDLGTAIIIFGITTGILLSLPFENENLKIIKKITYAFIGTLIFLLFFGSAVLKPLLTEEQQSRLTYRQPCTRHNLKTGYQVCNGFIAISNGGLLGKGLGNSTEKYLYVPEAHTDFVLPIFTEEFGILGVAFFSLFLFILLLRLVNISRNASSLRNSIIPFGTFLIIFLHLFVNFFGILALIPLTGVPVPFLSYGGSFFITIMALLFLSQRVHIEDYNYKYNKMYKGGKL